jgi:hypothetical protein
VGPNQMSTTVGPGGAKSGEHTQRTCDQAWGRRGRPHPSWAAVAAWGAVAFGVVVWLSADVGVVLAGHRWPPTRKGGSPPGRRGVARPAPSRLGLASRCSGRGSRAVSFWSLALVLAAALAAAGRLT